MHLSTLVDGIITLIVRFRLLVLEIFTLLNERGKVGNEYVSHVYTFKCSTYIV